MVYTQVVLARRKAGITHEVFRARYEQHMAMVARLVGGDAMPLRHTRRYVAQPPTPSSSPDPKAGDGEDNGTPLDYDVVVDMTFEDAAARDRFVAALAQPAVARAVADDEAAFWDRRQMAVALVDELRETIQAEALA